MRVVNEVQGNRIQLYCPSHSFKITAKTQIISSQQHCFQPLDSNTILVICPFDFLLVSYSSQQLMLKMLFLERHELFTSNGTPNTDQSIILPKSNLAYQFANQTYLDGKGEGLLKGVWVILKCCFTHSSTSSRLQLHGSYIIEFSFQSHFTSFTFQAHQERTPA